MTRSIVYAEVIRSANRQSKHVDTLLCKKCYQNLPEYKEAARLSSIAVINKITVGASERSRRLWTDPEYRNNHGIVVNGQSEVSKAKLSISISEKFKNDAEYVAKVKSARLKYWDDPIYRSSRTWDVDRFVSEARLVHGDKYLYDQVEYLGFRTKVAITCKEHGLFTQLPGHHIHFANGCPWCAADRTVSDGENCLAEWVESVGFKINRNDRAELGGVELDIYVPDRKLAIEYNGVYWHSYDRPESGPQRYRHHYKTTLAEAVGIRLMQFTDIEWLESGSVVRSMLSNVLGLSQRIHARKCSNCVPSEKEAEQFFNSNHLYGHRQASHYYGLEFNGLLICVLSISECARGHEIMRFATSMNHLVVGGLSKLLSAAQRDLNFRYLSTYADRRYSNAASYLAVGFNRINITPPGYKYFKRGVLYSRQKFQKCKLSSLLANFDESMTEAENMFAHGYRRIWDAGHHVLELIRS